MYSLTTLTSITNNFKIKGLHFSTNPTTHSAHISFIFNASLSNNFMASYT